MAKFCLINNTARICYKPLEYWIGSLTSQTMSNFNEPRNLSSTWPSAYKLVTELSCFYMPLHVQTFIVLWVAADRHSCVVVIHRNGYSYRHRPKRNYLSYSCSLSLSLLIKMSLCKKDNLKCFRDFLEIKLTEEFYSCTFYLPYTMV